MENTYESDKITNTACYTLLCTLYIAGELNYPFCKHCGYNTGCIIQTDGASDPLMRALHTIGDVYPCGGPKERRTAYKNYYIAVYVFQKYSKTEDVVSFIQDDRHLSIVIIQGCVPEELRDIIPVFSLETEDLAPEQLEKTKCDIHAIKNFLRNNPREMQDTLKTFQTSSEYEAHHSESSIRLVFDLAAQMYRLWFRSHHDENVTLTRYHEFTDNLNDILAASESYDSCEDLTGKFWHLLTDYLDAHPEINICHRDEVDGATSQKIDAATAILFNADYYYIPEKLFKEICAPLGKCCGLNAIKNSLHRSGIITCQNGSFTQKMAFTNSFGGSERHRFIFIIKNKVIPFGEPALEDRRTTDVSRKEQ